MTTRRSILNSLSRIALAGATAGAIVLAVLPAQAAGPSLGSSLNLGLEVAAPQVQAPGQQMQMKKFGYDDDDDDDWCADLSNKQIRKGLKKADFAEIDFVKELKHNRVRVEALYEDDGWVYSMRIDRCYGEVDQIEALYEYDDFDIDFDL
jgi:hypothetical protein